MAVRIVTRLPNSPRLGPDAARYWLMADGVPVPKPFHLRRLLPLICGQSIPAWRTVRLASWALLAVGMVAWRLAAGDPLGVAAAASAFLLALPGILGPAVVNPVGVDLPAVALGVWSAFLIELGAPLQIVAGVLVALMAAGVKESAPVWIALWAWSPWPLIGLVVPLVVAIVRRPGPDPLGPQFQHIADHPIRSALDAHAGRWRDAWLMVAPWGVCLAALVGADWRLVVVVVLAYAQLLVATDTVRLVQSAAGPVAAAAASSVIPERFLLLAVVLHACWWWKPERV